MKTNYIHILIGLLYLTGCNKSDDSTWQQNELQNEPPLSFDLVDVPDGAEDVDVTPTLTWESAKNPKGGNVTYDLYLGTETNPTTPYESGIANTSLEITDRLNLLTDYYWKVVATDAEERSSQSPVHKFSTRTLNLSEVPIVEAPGFTPRFGHTSVVFENKIWVISGDTGDFGPNDIWYSENGIDWLLAIASPAFSHRSGHTSVVYDDKIWVIGGFSKNDVLYSSDGILWEQATEQANFSERRGHTSVVFKNKMWVIGGDGEDFKNDVWFSSDGINWELATASAGFPVSSGHSTVVFDDKLWVIGGHNTGSARNDIWYSSDGIQLSAVAQPPPFTGRTNHSTTVFGGKIWIVGGRNGNKIDENEVWYSDDGMSWHQFMYSSSFKKKIHAHSTVVFQDRIMVLGGFQEYGLNDEVWTLD